MISTNPAKNYEVIGEVAISSDKEIKERVIAANQAKLAWKELGIEARIALLEPFYNKFADRKEDLALLITKEVGKPIIQSRGEVEGALRKIRWFLDNGIEALKNETTHEDDKSLHQIVYEPWGVAAVITPWNFPFSIFVWGTFTNLIAGNTVVFKISEECHLTGKLIEEIMESGDLPSGVFSEIYGAGDVGQKLVEDDINLICFTGSTKVGKQLYKLAGEKFIKAILEMGGSSPAIIFEDVDIDDIVQEIYAEGFINCGQVCDSLKRIIVHESIFEEFVDKIKKEIAQKNIGDPENESTHLGSLVAKRQLDLLERQVQDSINKGAKAIIGGKRPENLLGAFYEPTILTNISKDMPVWSEEVFGPVRSVISFKTEQEAIELANDTNYGLGSRVYSKDLERAKRVATKIDAGTVEINHGNRWLACNPFGGYKDSGMGREHGILGFRELCQIKVISMEK